MAEITDHVTMEEKFTRLENAKQIEANSCPKIQRVPHFLRDREQFALHYLPKLISMGPIHHGKENLKLGEQYKLVWAKSYLKRTRHDAKTLYKKIADEIEALKDLFTNDVIERFCDNEELSWMLFMDGCSVLEIMHNADYNNRQKLHIKADQVVLVLQDLVLLENQLPFQVLKLLSVDGNEGELIKTMNRFLRQYHLSPNLEDVQAQPPPAHILDHLRSSILCCKKTEEVDQKKHNRRSVNTNQPQQQGATHCIEVAEVSGVNQERRDRPWRPAFKGYREHQPHTLSHSQPQPESRGARNEDINRITHRNIQELKAAGIRVTTSNSRRLKDIIFDPTWFRAALKLPEITVDDSTAPHLLNLIAYEMCPDFENDYGVSSFVAFMDSLIDHPSDVKELRSAKVLHNALGSDEEVSLLFNIISKDLVPNMKTYYDVIIDIEKHYTSKWNSWIAQAYHTYFSTPWAIIGFHAAVIALVLTFIQTWYTINPGS